MLARTIDARTASLSGVVRDITGLPLVDTTVTLTTEAGQVVAAASTDGSGKYVFERVDAGRYTATALHPGFARIAHAVIIEPDRARSLDFALPPDAFAQTVTVAAQSPDSFHTLTATSALRIDVPLMDIPQAITIVPAEILRQQEIRDVGEVAKNVAGMGRAIGYSESADKFMIRGLLIDYALKNGFKTSSLLSFSDMANVERIEVLKGPSSLLYGRIEPGGVVNIVTKQPLAVRRQGGEITVGRYGVTRGVFDATGPLTASGGAAYRLIAAGEHDGSHRDLVSGNRGFFAPSFSWKATGRTTLTVEGEALKMSGVPDAGLPSDPISFTLPVNLSVGEPLDSIRNQNLRGAYYLTHRFNERWSPAQAASVLRADAARKHVYAPNGRVMDDRRTFARQLLDEREASLSQFVRVDVVGKPEIAGQAHVLLVSLEGGRERYENGISVFGLPPIDLYQPEHGATFPPSGTPQQVRNQGADTLGAVVQDQWTISDHWKIAIGGRADVARTIYHDVVNQPPPPSTAPPVGPPPGSGMPPPGGGNAPVVTQAIDPTRRDSKEHVDAFSPRLGVVFQPRRTASLYASYSRSFNPLQLIHYINLVNLEPFRATQYEGGLKLDLFGARLQTTAAVFTLEANGYAIPAGRPGSVTFDGYKRSSGVEMETTAHPGRVSIIGSYTFNTGDKRVGFPGQSLMNAARHSGSAWGTWTMRDGRLRGLALGGGAFAVGRRVANLLDSLVIPAYVRVDGYASYDRQRWALQLNLKNVASERYYETDAVQGLLLPGAPFCPELTFRVRF